MAWTDGSAAFAADRAADLTAVLAPGGEPAQPDPEAVAAVLRAYDEPEPLALTTADVAGMAAVAADLHGVFAAPDQDTAAHRLNALLAAHAGPPRLTDHGGTTAWHLHADATDDGPWPAWFATSSAVALATLLAARQGRPGGLCAAPGCDRPYADHGRGDPRRHCSTRCATRARVAAHRARQAAVRDR